MAKIIVIDDHTLFRVGLVAILKKELKFEIVGEYGSFGPLKAQIPTLDAHVLLVDISFGNEIWRLPSTSRM